MKVSWNFSERYGAILLLAGVQHASMKDWKIIKDAQKKLEITKEEMKDLNIVARDGHLTWNKDSIKSEYKYDMDEKLIKTLREKLNILNQKNMIPSALVPLAEKLGLE